MAVSHGITFIQSRLLTACQIRYHSHLWDHLSAHSGVLVCVCARMLRNSALEALLSRFNLVSDSAHSLFRVRSSASVSCGILVALKSTEPRAPTLSLVLRQ